MVPLQAKVTVAPGAAALITLRSVPLVPSSALQFVTWSGAARTGSAGLATQPRAPSSTAHAMVRRSVAVYMVLAFLCLVQ
jgi:hypothetical protein